MNDRRYILDASALLALIQDEPGAQRVAEVLNNSVISTVNLAEVAAKLGDYGMPPAEVAHELKPLNLTVVPFDERQALNSGALRGTTRASGLSLGDRACLAAAEATGRIALASDRSWLALKLSTAVEAFR